MVSCPPPILIRELSKDSRRISILRLGRPFAAVGSPQVFIRTDPHSPLEVYADHVRHRSSLSAVPALRRSVEEHSWSR